MRGGTVVVPFRSTFRREVEIMRAIVMSLFLVGALASTPAQTPPLPATDITAADINRFIAALPRTAVSDLPIRVVDVGGYKLGVYGVFRPKALAGDAILHETRTSEVYYILDGAGTLVTGATLADLKAPTKRLSGISVRANRIDGGVTRRVAKGGRRGHSPDGRQTLK